MEIIIPCARCALEARNVDGSFGPEGVVIPMVAVHVQEQRLYRATCPNGHPVVGVLDHHAHELLFESGLEAFVDGYFRESVSSFAAALERLYEFSIRVHLIASGVSAQDIDKMWKSVASQSERQLGMYIGVRTTKDGIQPPILNSDLTQFRNSVIHKGYFPSAEEAFNFGEAIFDLILSEVQRLDEHYKSSVLAQNEALRLKALLLIKEGENPSSFGFGLAVASGGEQTFSQIVARMQGSKRRWRSGEPPPASLGS